VVLYFVNDVAHDAERNARLSESDGTEVLTQHRRSLKSKLERFTSSAAINKKSKRWIVSRYDKHKNVNTVSYDIVFL
jgi:phosphoribosylformylglycinamidine (FGAM) synthase-like enzyme